MTTSDRQSGLSFRVIEFRQPGEASLVQDKLPAQVDKTDAKIATVRTLCTSVSPGTELLAYKGEMPSDVPADATFATQNESLTYPCRYGYSAVGVVDSIHNGNGDEENGTSCDDKSNINCGTRVFAFREHTSKFRQPVDQLIRVPPDIADRDATLLPAFETAVSIICDAAVGPGDCIAVTGQGLIGLCVVAALRRLHPYSRVVTFDVDASRRALSTTAAGAHTTIDATKPYATRQRALREALACTSATGADVAIEVSGVAAGLDVAIEATRDYGRVVLASWYGTKQISLGSLGGRFHRSHISLVASQVSNIPAHLSPRWSKERRFQLAWGLIRDIKPSTLFDIPIFLSEECPLVYKRLAKREIISAIFQFHGNAPVFH